jgi:hypothetical protein
MPSLSRQLFRTRLSHFTRSLRLPLSSFLLLHRSNLTQIRFSRLIQITKLLRPPLLLRRPEKDHIRMILALTRLNIRTLQHHLIHTFLTIGKLSQRLTTDRTSKTSHLRRHSIITLRLRNLPLITAIAVCVEMRCDRWFGE